MLVVAGNDVTLDPNYWAEFSSLQYHNLDFSEFDSDGNARLVANNLGGLGGKASDPKVPGRFSDPPMIRMNDVTKFTPRGTTTELTIDLRIFNTTEYRVANTVNNGLAIGNKMVQINIRALYDETDATTVADPTFVLAMSALVPDLGTIAAQKRYSNNLNLVYVFTDRGTNNLVELEE